MPKLLSEYIRLIAYYWFGDPKPQPFCKCKGHPISVATQSAKVWQHLINIVVGYLLFIVLFAVFLVCALFFWFVSQYIPILWMILALVCLVYSWFAWTTGKFLRKVIQNRAHYFK